MSQSGEQKAAESAVSPSESLASISALDRKSSHATWLCPEAAAVMRGLVPELLPTAALALGRKPRLLPSAASVLRAKVCLPSSKALERASGSQSFAKSSFTFEISLTLRTKGTAKRFVALGAPEFLQVTLFRSPHRAASTKLSSVVSLSLSALELFSMSSVC